VAAALLSGCAILHDNVKGSFACKAPDGTCAPSSVIDDAAIAAIREEPAGVADPSDVPGTDSRRGATANHGSWHPRPPMAATESGTNTLPGALRPGTRVLRVVFPAYVDREGQLHETAGVQLTLDDGLPGVPASPVAEQAAGGPASADPRRPGGPPALLELAEQAPDISAMAPSPTPTAAPVPHAEPTTTASGTAKPPAPSPIDAIKADVASALAAPPRKATNFPATSE
jgi:conjugal transfer pilus assembly protein TraV